MNKGSSPSWVDKCCGSTKRESVEGRQKPTKEIIQKVKTCFVF
jgi:hypothetical protein